MLTRLRFRNFKRFCDANVELGGPVVFVGPNDSGKTSAMQALALWSAGLSHWFENYGTECGSGERPRITINRQDLHWGPVLSAKDLWYGKRTRKIQRRAGIVMTENTPIEVIVRGVNEGRSWECGLEFDYANQESIDCRPLKLAADSGASRVPVPSAASRVQIAFLTSISGLATTEPRLDPGAIDVRIGEGRCAEVLRNLCFMVHREQPGQWAQLAGRIRGLFGTELEEPQYLPSRGEVRVSYRKHGTSFDLASAGQGLQQTLLLLAFMYSHPRSVVLLDDPDAHLEPLRQRQTYELLRTVAADSGSQVVIATHSEALLNEAAGQDLVIAFAGKPYRLADSRGQVVKSLRDRDIGLDQFLQAEQTGWILYLPESTHLSILRALARRTRHGAGATALDRPFVHYVGNDRSVATRHFLGIKQALPRVRGLALFERLDVESPMADPLECLQWKKREIENYICTRRTLDEYVRATARADVTRELLRKVEEEKRLAAMETSVKEISVALETLGKSSPWSAGIRASDEFIEPLFKNYFKRLRLPNLMANKSFYELAEYIPEDEIDSEVTEKLDAIAAVAENARSHRP